MAIEATADEMNMAEAINKERNKDIDTETQVEKPDSGPNIVIYIFMVGLIGLPGDLLKFIPVLGGILAFPFTAMMWFWRVLSGRFKTSPIQKIMVNGALQAVPFTNTFFLTSCYMEETKLGKAILSKAKYRK